MTNTQSRKITLLKAYLWAMGVFTLFWWPLSHWFYPAWYHGLLGFETFDRPLVTIIGTTGFLAFLNIVLAAWDPVRNRSMILALILFSVAMAGTYAFLINTCGFPVREYANMGLLIANTLILIALYPQESQAIGNE